MGRAYIDGKDVILFIKRSADLTFRAVACLEANQFNLSREKKVIKNKCTGDYEDGIAGGGSFGFTGNGQAITDETAGEANYQELAVICAAGEIIEIKMANADGTYYRAGTGLITEFTEDATAEDPLTFNVTLSGNGVPVLVKPV